MIKNKKAGLPDGFFIIVAFFAIALIFLMVFTVLLDINTFFQATDFISDQGKSISSELVGEYSTLFDRLFLFIVVGLIFAIVAGSFIIPGNPALFWFAIPLLAFMIFMGGMFGNIYWEISNHPELSTAAESFPITTFIFQNFVIIITGAILIFAAALFAKSRIK